MLTRTELIQHIEQLIHTRMATTAYVNGPPGAGKSHLLHCLQAALHRSDRGQVVLGPYQVQAQHLHRLGTRVLRECQDMSFLDTSAVLPRDLTLNQVWPWFVTQALDLPDRTFIVLVDLAGTYGTNSSELASLFSSARELESSWNHPRIRVHHLFAGNWDDVALNEYYVQMQTSFPYAPTWNMLYWTGLCASEMGELLHSERPEEDQPLYAGLLFELTGGHPAAALDILNYIPSGGLCLPALLRATRKAAMEGPAGQALLASWAGLGPPARRLLQKLLLRRHLSAELPAAQVDPLLAHGIARRERFETPATGHWLAFRSWYAELLVRYHLDKLGLEGVELRRIRPDELAPEIRVLNAEAYRMITEIETIVRNFAVVQLCLQQPPGVPILQDQVLRDDRAQFNDAHTRALKWQERNHNLGLPDGLNPAIAYTMTKDLAKILEEIAKRLDSAAWLQISEAIRRLKPVRDAVMHHQFIDDATLQGLYDLQAEVLRALDAGQ